MAFTRTTELGTLAINKKRPPRTQGIRECEGKMFFLRDIRYYSSSLLVRCLSSRLISGFTLKTGAAGATFGCSAGAPWA